MTKLIFNILIAGSFIAGIYLPGKKIAKPPQHLLLNPKEEKGQPADTVIFATNPEGTIKSTHAIKVLYKAW